MNEEVEKLELALRMQKRMTQEEREKANKARQELEEVKLELAKAGDMLDSKDKEMEFLRNGAITKTQAALAEAHAQLEAKDQMIETLKQRVSNINDEFNRSFGRGRQESSPRTHTTLEDVYKMTGEPYSKDNRCP